MVENNKLTKEEVNSVLRVWDALEFSRSFYEGYLGYYNTPDAVNQAMKNINMNPVQATVSDIEEALSKPKESEMILRDYAMALENQNMYYKRLIRYFSDLPAFNMSFYCYNIKDDAEYKSEEFKNDLAVLEEFCERFDAKEEFKTVIRQLLRQGVFYCVLRDEGKKYVLQELPANFSQITGKFDYGLLFDFNFDWFISNYGVDINMYPPIFKKMYKTVFKNVSQRYNPAKDLDHRTGSYAYWHQTSPNDGFWAWKINPEITTLIPYFAPLMPDIALEPIIRGLQTDKYFIEASKIIAGIIGFNKNNKSGNVANQINITPTALGKFLGVARKGINKQIGLMALPVDDIKAIDFETREKNSLDEYTKNLANLSTSSSSVLLDNGKLNVHQSKLASTIDNNFVKSMYPMFANFIEFFVNRKTSHYKFKIMFNDFNTIDDYERRRETAEFLAGKGIPNWEIFARLNDMNIFEFKKHVELENCLLDGINDKFIQLQNLYTQSKNQVGRPRVQNTDNQSTMDSQARGTEELV